MCHAPDQLKVALVSLHPWEEPPISGTTGAGTVFFSHCNLRCAFCQNHDISASGNGKTISTKRLTEIFLEQQARGATCIELVTPTHYTDKIIPALIDAKASGLSLPIAYNTNGYDLPEVIKRYEGLVDIFMPDLKYFDNRYAAKYSGAPHYFETASLAIKTMFELVGEPQYDNNGLMRKGVIIRHLVLPWLYKDSFSCLDWISSTFGNRVVVSIMNQYTPLFKADRHPEINRQLTTLEYQKVIRYADHLGLSNVFIQVGKTSDKKYIPIFDNTNV